MANGRRVAFIAGDVGASDATYVNHAFSIGRGFHASDMVPRCRHAYIAKMPQMSRAGSPREHACPVVSFVPCGIVDVRVVVACPPPPYIFPVNTWGPRMRRRLLPFAVALGSTSRSTRRHGLPRMKA